MTKPAETEPDAIDEMLAALTGFLGVAVERGRPKWVGLRALAESTVYALVEHAQATQPAARSGISVVAAADLLYNNASDLWASRVVHALETEGLIEPSEQADIAAWLAEKQEEEREQCTARESSQQIHKPWR